MAFQLNPKLYSVNASSEGIYLLPMRWFKYGLENGHLSITNKFYNSYQGGLYLSFKDNPLTVEDNYGTVYDVWYGSEPGTGTAFKAVMTQDVQVFGSPNKLKCFKTINEMRNWDASRQFETNAELIRLFAGCNVTLEDRVWF